ncbi:MAG: enoyl-CoA hydratase-related protein [Solirubrobacterales bacterium]
MSERKVEFTSEAGIGRLRLACGDRHNAIDDALVDALAAAVDDLGREPALRAVLIGADGPSFSVGGDVAHFAGHADDLAAELDRMVAKLNRALTRLAKLPLPVICAAQGAVAGGGLGLLWCSDVILAADDLKIVTGYDRLGLSSDGGNSWALPRLVGRRRARQILFGGRALDATDALAWGLVDRVVPAAELAGEADAEARRLASGPTVAYAQIKRLLDEGESAGWSEQLDAERRAMVTCAETADAREGVESFVGRRAPAFEGR